MTNTIKLKRGTSTPSTSDISSGEVAIDTSAKKLYINDSGTVKEIGGGGVSSDAQQNTVAGSDAGINFDGTNANQNTLFGQNAGKNITTGDNNTVFGAYALNNLTTGSNNVIMGNSTGYSLTTGGYNTFVGHQAGEGSTTATNNVQIGYRSGISNSSGGNNVFVGYKSANANTTGQNNVILGHMTALGNTTGQSNVYIGFQAAVSATTAGYNVGIGRQCFEQLTTGNFNISIGYQGMDNVTTGGSNTGIGQYAGNVLTTGSNNSFLGNGSEPSSATVSNEITLGNTSVTKFRVPGISLEATSTGVTTTGLKLGDSTTSADHAVIFGADSDMRLYHDGSNGVFQNDTGALYLQNGGSGADIYIRAKAGESSILCTADNQVKLFYNGNEKLGTLDNGVGVTGNLDVAGGVFIGGSDHYLYQDSATRVNFRVGPSGGTHVFGTFAEQESSFAIGNASGDLRLTVGNESTPETAVLCKNNAGVHFFCDNIQQFETQADGVLFGDGKAAKFGANADLKLWHDGNHSNLRTTEGAMYLEAPAGTWTYRPTSTGGLGIAHFNSDVGSTGALRAYITADGDYVDVSDYRLKQDLVSITNGIDLVKQLNPTTFKWKNDTSKKVYGFIAHEVQEVLPEIVTGEKDGEENQFLCKADFIPVLTAALREAIAKIETLETKVAALEAG